MVEFSASRRLCCCTALKNATAYTFSKNCWIIKLCKLSCAQPVAYEQPISHSCWLRDHATSCLLQTDHSVDEFKRWLIDMWCSLEQSIFDEAIDQWRGTHRACAHAKGWHFEYSLWTDNDDFLHIGYIQCDLFYCYIFNYEIMSATLANTLLFISQGSALADLRYGSRC